MVIAEDIEVFILPYNKCGEICVDSLFLCKGLQSIAVLQGLCLGRTLIGLPTFIKSNSCRETVQQKRGSIVSLLNNENYLYQSCFNISFRIT